MNKKGQIFDFDLGEISVVGILFFLIGFIIAFIIAAKMNASLPMRLINGVFVGVICYFIGASAEQ